MRFRLNGELCIGASATGLAITRAVFEKFSRFAKCLFLVDTSVKPSNQLLGLNAKRFRYSQQGSYSDWSACFDLLPMAGRKAEANHVFLGVAVSLTEFLDPNTKGTKELSFIDHPLYLEN
jgi:hypothetical protein